METYLPLQQDSVSCGVFTCIHGQNFIRYDSININIDFLNELCYWIALNVLDENGSHHFHSYVIKGDDKMKSNLH